MHHYPMAGPLAACHDAHPHTCGLPPRFFHCEGGCSLKQPCPAPRPAPCCRCHTPRFSPGLPHPPQLPHQRRPKRGKDAVRRATPVHLGRRPPPQGRARAPALSNYWAKVPGRPGRECHPETGGPPHAPPPRGRGGGAARHSYSYVAGGGGRATAPRALTQRGLLSH